LALPLPFFSILAGGVAARQDGEKGMMPQRRIEMATLWILRGDHQAPGWNELRKAYDEKTVEIIHLDAKVWAIIDAEEEPTGYQGLAASRPADGMYIDPNGTPLYLVGGGVVTSAEAVVEGLGQEAKEMMEKVGDAGTALERLRKVY
jgi:hypothetical protein